jgi:hypothetical protein
LNESNDFQNRKQPKINPKIVAYFPAPKKRPSKHHIHHASHHKFTIKKPHPAITFSQNPLQKQQNGPSPTTAKKSVHKSSPQPLGNPPTDPLPSAIH